MELTSSAQYTRAISRCRWPKALKLLDQMQVRSVEHHVITFNASLHLISCWRKALDLLERAAREVRLDSFSYTSALRGAWEVGWHLMALAIQSSLEPELQAKNRLVRDGPWQRGLDFVEDVVGYGSLLSSSSAWDFGLSSARKLREDGLQGNVITCGALVSLCARAFCWWQALSLLVEPNVVVLSAAASGCQKGGQWIRAQNLLLLSVLWRLEPNELTFNAAMGHAWPLSLRILAELRGQQLRVSAVNSSTALQSCRAAAAWRVALSLLPQADDFLAASAGSVCQEAALWRVALRFPGQVAEISSLSACERASAWEKALEIFAGRQADVVTYGAATAGCQKAAKWRAANQLLAGAERGIRADFVAYHGAVRAGEWHRSLQVLSRMRQRHVESTIVSYSAAMCPEISAAWECAWELLEDSMQIQLEMSIIAFGASLGACERAAEWELAIQMLEEVDSEGLEANVIMLNSALSACQTAIAWLEAIALHAGKREGLEPDRISQVVLTGALAEASEWELALLSLEGEVLDLFICNAVLDACEKTSKWQQALWISGRMEEWQLRRDVVTYNSLLLSCQREWQQALCLFSCLQAEALEADVTAIAAVITACARSGHLEQVNLLLKSAECLTLARTRALKRLEEKSVLLWKILA